MDFANNVLFKSYGKKTTFLLCWHGRPYDDKGSSLTLLDGTAFQASTLVACTEGPLHKEKYTYFALCFYFLGKLTRPRLVARRHSQTDVPRPHPLLSIYMAPWPFILLISLLCHTRTPRLMHFCALILIAVSTLTHSFIYLQHIILH